MKDLFGKAILDFQTNNEPENLITETSISDEDEMDVAYLFRSFDEMPELERKALQLAKGRILDIGCGAGSHSLYLQEERELEVSSIDISVHAIEACRLRGLKDARVKNVMDLKSERYDTLLLLMNGAGMCGRLKNLPEFLRKLKSLLDKNGQILLDSSDIIYMFDDDDSDGCTQGEAQRSEAKWIPSDTEYYGEVVFNIAYKGKKEKPFDWMYIDFNTLNNAANANGLECELVLEGTHYDYLAKLTTRK